MIIYRWILGADYADFTDNLFTVKRWIPLVI